MYSIHTFSQGKIDGFYRGQGNATFVIGYGHEDNKNYLIGEVESNLNRTVTYLNLFASYGVLDDLDLQISLPYIESNENKDFQDIGFFSKYRFLNREHSNAKLELSFAIGFSTPISDYAIGGLFDIGQQATVLDTRAILHYQWKSNWFATLQSGYSHKFEEVPSSIPLVFKTGLASSKWYFDVFYDYQYALGGIDYRGTPAPQNFRKLGVDYHKIGGTLYTTIYRNFGAYINYANIFEGRNTFQGPSYSIGIVYNLKKTNK
ncbi:hypothetical protein [Winogradskyella ursingii]|uniref:hypothetical protein n=1 Tax=Winogradskyella ursingii TaxID=2686079 RepID=UPI0015C9C452|nr:hypothetical protein [Winogradskyella ursingii]